MNKNSEFETTGSRKNVIGGVNRYNVSAFLLVMIIMPASVIFSYTVLGENRLFFLSASLITIILFVFFLIFEGHKPDARTLIIIAVMSAVGVVGRTIFFFAPNFKPILAVIILTGITFGRNVGFLTGASAAFVSNFIFGQGPWTPWQMIAMGITGYLAGVFFDDGKNGRRRNRYKENTVLMTVAYCVFGFFAAVVIYGGIVDLWTIFGFMGEFSVKSVITVYTAALGMNLIHGVATVNFLLVLVIPIKGKLDRVKIKYGLVKAR